MRTATTGRKSVSRALPVLAVVLMVLVGLLASPQAVLAQAPVLTSSGIWTDVDMDDDDTLSGLGTLEIRWGSPAYFYGNKSGYRFDGNTVLEPLPLDTEFKLGALTHYNYPISAGTSITAATLDVTLDFVHPDFTDQVFTFDFDHYETPNDARPCPVVPDYCGRYDYYCECPDIVTFPNAYPEESFRIGDKIYTLHLEGFVDSDGDVVDQFITRERRTNTADLVATLSSVLVPEPAIRVTKETSSDDTDWHDANDAPGPYVPVGQPVYWQYLVQNTGNVTLSQIVVTDDDSTVAVTCPKTILAPGESMTCTASGTAVAGQYSNIGSVEGTPPSGSAVTDSDPSHYFGATAGIDVEKLVSVDGGTTWVDADSPTGPVVPVDADVHFKFIVTNTGNVDLINVSLSDSDFPLTGCPVPGSLASGGSFDCVIGPITAAVGQHTNTATASGEYGGVTYTDTDDANYYGAALTATKTAEASYTRTYSWTIDKSVSDETLDAFAGESVTVDYDVALDQTVVDSGWRVEGTITVTNPTPLEVEFTVSDVVGGTSATVDCPASTIAAGGSVDCTYSVELDDAIDGTNTATITSNTPGVGGTTATADYAFGEPTVVGEPEISVVDVFPYPDGTSKDLESVSDDYTFEYDRQFTCSSDSADYTNGFYSYSKTDRATIAGTEMYDEATVTVNCYAPVLKKTVTATYDETHTWSIVKTVDPIDQTGAPGDSLSWNWTVDVTETFDNSNFAVSGTISVTNPSPDEAMEVTLSDVMDDGTAATITGCTGGTLAGDVLTLLADSTAVCEYTAVPTGKTARQNRVTGTINGISFTDTASVNFVRNPIGGTATVTDGQIGLNQSLTAGEGPWHFTDTGSHTCADLASGLYADTGSYGDTVSNTATVTASNGQTASDEASTEYVCSIEAQPAIGIEKSTNGQDADTGPGPDVSVGNPVMWSYVVTNTGNVTLTNVAVTDDQEGAISCPATELGVGESITCSAHGIAELGQYANLGTVVAYFGEEQVTDSDPSHYFGAVASIDIEKATNGEDADSPTGPIIVVGAPVSWTYVVTNTGNVPLVDVTVVDDNGTPADPSDDYSCSIGTLAADATDSTTCSQTGTAQAGQYGNLATVSGVYESAERTVEDSDPSHYFGADAALSLDKTATPTTYAAVDDIISYSYELTNSGNVTLNGPFTVTDDKATVTCPADATLAVGASITCTASYAITQADLDAGSVTNVAVGHGYYGETVVDSNVDEETVEALTAPAIEVVKSVSVDGQSTWLDANDAPGPVTVVDDDVYFKFVVTNTGNVTLSGIELTDNVYDLTGCEPAIVDPLAPGASFECTVGPLAAAEGQHVNTATASGEYGEGTYDDTDDAHYVSLAADVVVTKTADVEWIRYYSWDISKVVDKPEIALFLPADTPSVGDTVTYTIVASRTVAEDVYTVSGIVSLTNGGSGIAKVTSLVDQLQMSTDGGETWVAVAEEILLDSAVPLELNPDDPAADFPYSFGFAPVEGAVYRNVAKVGYGTILGGFAQTALPATELVTILDPSVSVPVELPTVPDEEVNATASVSDVETITSGGAGLTFAVQSVSVAGVDQSDLVGPWPVTVGQDGTATIAMVKDLEADREGTWVLNNVAMIEPEGPSAEADVVIQVEAEGPPTAVQLVSWTAVGGAGTVTHTWETAFEKDTLAFRIYRGADLATAELVGEVAAQGRAAGYQLVDQGLASGNYSYWLVEVEADGSQGQVYGAKVVTVGAAGQESGDRKVYLPLTLK